MAGDPLYEPLGTRPPDAPMRVAGGAKGLWLGAAALVVAAGGVAAWVTAHHPPASDSAVAVARIEQAPASPPAVPASAPVQVVEVAPPATPSAGNTVEVQNGVKIYRFTPAASSGSVTIPVDPAADRPLAPAPDPRVTEKTADGPLPRIAADGTRASTIYARRPLAATGPRLALLLTGFGLDQLATAQAARSLSPDMSFAFAPGVADAAAQVSETRRTGHEVFLDLPEGSGDGGGGGGLRRQLGRYAGYVGVLLPRTMADAFDDVSRRGVLALASDGTAGAGDLNVDVVVDAGHGAAALAAALDKLAQLALAKGSALGIIGHATQAQDALAAFPARLAGQGVSLVPASALASRPAKAAKTDQ